MHLQGYFNNITNKNLILHNFLYSKEEALEQRCLNLSQIAICGDIQELKNP